MRTKAKPAKKAKAHHTAATRNAFRAALLELGVVRAAAKAVGVAEATAKGWAREAEADPEFIAARTALRKGALEKVEIGLVRVAEAALERVLDSTIHEPRDAWGVLLVKIHDTLTKRMRPTGEADEDTKAAEKAHADNVLRELERRIQAHRRAENTQAAQDAAEERH